MYAALAVAMQSQPFLRGATNSRAHYDTGFAASGTPTTLAPQLILVVYHTPGGRGVPVCKNGGAFL